MEEIIRLWVMESGQRLDKYIAQEVPTLSRATVQKLIKGAHITVNAELSKASYRVQTGDVIHVRVPVVEPVVVRPEQAPLDIVYEDDDLIVVNKPAGMVVHPAYGHQAGTLVNALLAHCPALADEGQNERPGIVHRLDKDTSGLIIVAKNESSRRHLQGQFKRREVKKVYLALVEGQLTPRRGAIEAPIGRDRRQRKRMAVVREGRAACTAYRVVEYFANHTLLEVEPKTGRTHQIRVHLAFIGHPVVGDAVYGFRKQRLKVPRQFLHASYLGFRRPSDDQYLELQVSLPPDLRQVWDKLRAEQRIYGVPPLG